MKKNLNLVCECYVDTRLAQILTRSNCRHEANKGQVANALKDKLRNFRALGMVDEDPNKGVEPRYFSEFSLLDRRHGLQFFRHRDREHFLVKISPAVERWLLDAAAAIAIRPSDSGLPDSLDELRKYTKHPRIADDGNFKRFIHALLQGQSPRLRLLESWLSGFLEGPGLE